MKRLLPFTLLALMTPHAQPQTIASLVDKSRILLLFAPSDTSPLFQRQLTLLAHHGPDLAERDLVLLPILGNAGPAASTNTLRDLHPPVVSPTLSIQEQLTLRHRFHIAPGDFTILLLGKDGGEKLRQQIPITLEKLNATIDAMPMRRDEIRTRLKR